MKVVITITILVLIFSFGYYLFSFRETDYEYLSDVMVKRVSKRLENRHNIRLIGEGGGFLRCINSIAITFKLNGSLSKEQAREMIIDCSEELLKEINQDSKIQPFLCHYPFEPKDVHVGIIIYDKKGASIFFPGICSVGSTSGNIYYRTQVPNKRSYETEEIEPYEDALKISKDEYNNPIR